MTRIKKVAIALSVILVFSMLFAACSAKDANPDTLLLSVTDEAIDFC